MTVLRTGTTARIGLSAECFLGQAPGSTALTDFMGTSTTAMILATVIMDRFRSVGRSSSTTSMEMKLGMGEAMKGRLPTGRRGNTRYRAIEAAAGIRADTTKYEHETFVIVPGDKQFPGTWCRWPGLEQEKKQILRFAYPNFAGAPSCSTQDDTW
jgi:hypothetical protein